MSDEIASAKLQQLLGVNKSTLSELAQKGIIERGAKHGFCKLEASVSGYCAHLRGLT